MSAHQHPNSASGYERQDLSIRAIVIVAVVIAGALIAAAGVTAWMFGVFESQAVKRDVAMPPRTVTPALPQEPRLQVDAPKDLQTFRTGEEKRLTTYGWVNKTNGQGRIPIERAMELLVERGVSGGRP